MKKSLLFGEKNTVEAKAWLDKHYSDSSPRKSTVCEWYNEFNRGRSDIIDAERSGRPNTEKRRKRKKSAKWF